eukprot:scaffold272486_cov18-Tisochrysis_lutea.AAC.1
MCCSCRWSGGTLLSGACADRERVGRLNWVLLAYLLKGAMEVGKGEEVGTTLSNSFKPFATA